MKKRYWLFAGYSHYPHGGMRDYIASFYSVDDAVKWFDWHNDDEDMDSIEYDWYEVLDAETMKIVKRYGEPCYPDYRNFGVSK